MEEHYKEAHSVMFRAYACESCTYTTDKKPRFVSLKFLKNVLFHNEVIKETF
jgi:hypothetical protein